MTISKNAVVDDGKGIGKASSRSCQGGVFEDDGLLFTQCSGGSIHDDDEEEVVDEYELERVYGDAVSNEQ